MVTQRPLSRTLKAIEQDTFVQEPESNVVNRFTQEKIDAAATIMVTWTVFCRYQPPRRGQVTLYNIPSIHPTSPR
jgi:hypothetical protein